MPREIMFKAKSIEENVWVHGFPYLEGDQAFICLMGSKTPVRKETICEYTGLTAWGVDIYENDIYTVEENVKNAMLRKVIHHVSGFTGFQIGRKQEHYNRQFVPVDNMGEVKNQIKVIGNTIDNPELIDEHQRTADELFEVAADWWIDKTFNKLFNQNNGEPDHNLLLNFCALESKKDITKEQIDIFRSELIKGLKSDDRRWIFIGVDYHPGQYLAEACEKAKINDICLPCKSDMHIYTDEGYITVSFGYGAPHIQI